MSVQELDHKYHTLGDTEVSDSYYDVLKKEAKTTSIGSPPVKNKRPLPVCLGSLTKISRDNSLSIFQEKNTGPYVASDKIDGLTGLLHYDGKAPPVLYSRGDSIVGQDITSILPYIKGVPQEFKNPSPDTKPFSIRGELVLMKEDEPKASRRNIATGLIIAAKNPDPKKLSQIHMVPYTVYLPDKMKPSKQMAWLKEHDWTPVWNTGLSNLEYDSLSDMLLERRDAAPYDIDGIVIFQDAVHPAPDDGKVSYAFAFKDVMKDDSAEAIVKNVIWKISKNGAMKPTAEFDDPPTLNGAVISKASCHNAAYIRDNKIGKGARVRLVRSGSVIPHITHVLEPSPVVELPPDTIWNSKDLMAQNQDCTLPQLENFFTVFKVTGLSVSGLKALHENGYVYPLDVLNRLTEKDAQTIIGKANGTKIYNNLEAKKKNLDFYTFVLAHGIIQGGFGAKKLELLKNMEPELFNYKNLDISVNKGQLLSLPGVSDITANKLKEGIDSLNEFKKKNKKELDQLYGSNI